MSRTDTPSAPRQDGMPGAITGTVYKIIFRARNNGYRIGDLLEENGTHVRFLGQDLAALHEGMPVILTGTWIDHPTYGMELMVSSIETPEPDRQSALVRFFSSSYFPGIGEKSAQRIVEELGEDAIEKILEEPEVLTSKCSLRPVAATALLSALKVLGNKRDMLLHLMEWRVPDHEISILLANQKVTLDMLKEDCFRPYYSITSFSYDASQRLADGFDIPQDDPIRQRAAIFNTLKSQCFSHGSTYLSEESLYYACGCLPGFRKSLEELADRQLVAMENGCVFPYTLWQEEILIAAVLYCIEREWKKEGALERLEIDEDKLSATIERLEAEFHIQYDEIQINAIRTFFRSPAMILSGGPGTGKTTIVKAILRCLHALIPSSRVQLCAPTGRAAKRLSELSGENARTIHSLLGWDAETDQFSKDMHNPINCEFLIVDEFSMVDTHLFSSLLQALPSTCRILLIGDEEQLESVGPGRVLGDLIASGRLPIVRLERLYRQKEGSAIAQLADEIRHEQTLTYEKPVFLYESEQDQTEQVRKLVSAFESPANVQLLSPKYEGTGGIFELNQMMQDLLNPFHPQLPQISASVKLKSGGRHTIWYRPGDKVMLKANMSELDIYNGDIGEIVEVDEKTRTVLVAFDNAEIELSNDIYRYLYHGWCVSIHKAQGSEYQDVILSLPESAQRMLRKRLIYTGVSRAKRTLSIVTTASRLENAVRTYDDHKRQTTLLYRLNAVWEHGLEALGLHDREKQNAAPAAPSAEGIEAEVLPENETADQDNASMEHEYENEGDNRAQEEMYSAAMVETPYETAPVLDDELYGMVYGAPPVDLYVEESALPAERVIQIETPYSAIASSQRVSKGELDRRAISRDSLHSRIRRRVRNAVSAYAQDDDDTAVNDLYDDIDVDADE